MVVSVFVSIYVTHPRGLLPRVDNTSTQCFFCALVSLVNECACALLCINSPGCHDIHVLNTFGHVWATWLICQFSIPLIWVRLPNLKYSLCKIVKHGHIVAVYTRWRCVLMFTKSGLYMKCNRYFRKIFARIIRWFRCIGLMGLIYFQATNVYLYCLSSTLWIVRVAAIFLWMITTVHPVGSIPRLLIT